MLTMKELFWLFFVCSALVANAEETEIWTAPEYTKTFKNPVNQEDFDYSIEEGKYFFSRHCISCHGRLGLGDGNKAEKYNPPPANLTSLKVQKQTDGEIYWKISHGRNKMLSFKKILPMKISGI